MEIISRQFTYRKKGDFESLSLNKDILRKIVDDLRSHAGGLSPLNHWHLVKKDEESDALSIPDSSIADRYDKDMEEQYKNAEKMLDAWIGCVGMQPLSAESIKENEAFLSSVDYLGLFDYIKRSGLEEYDYKVRDLSTIAEVNMLYAGLEKTSDRVKHVLEVGGGYGRIAEAIMNTAEDIKYVMVDAVPGSILYSYEYLKKMLSNKKIGFYYLEDEFDLEKYDVYIIPAWHFEEYNRCKYDCCINISSMQEMGQTHVDYYLELFDRVLKKGGIAYIQNSHDYLFKGEWKYNKSWERVFMCNTPASWTAYFPTEIFVKREADYSRWNQCVLAGYEYALKEKQILNLKINGMQNEIWRLQYAESELDKARKEIEELKTNQKEIKPAKRRGLWWRS